jgi:hypothetical protein
MPESSDGSLLAELKTLINETGSYNEVQCSAYLNHVPEVLLKSSMIIGEGLLYSGYIADCGISDYIAVADIITSSGYRCRRAYVWELKAPQCFGK